MKISEKRSSSQQMVWYCFRLHTQNPGLKEELELEPSPKKGSDKTNRLSPTRKNTTENKLHCTAWTHKKEPSTLREVDLEHSAKRGTNRTKALVGLYWLSWSLSMKQSFNRVLNKSSFVKPIKSSRTWKDTNQIPKLHALKHNKINFPTITNSINVHDWGYKWVCHTQR